MRQSLLALRSTIVWTVFTLIVFAQHPFFGGQLTAQTATPAMATDRPEYFLGDTVQISGSGFAAFEAVTVTVHRASFWLEGDHPAHEPFIVAADALGRFTASWVLADGIGVNFYVLGDGSISGFARQAEFNRSAILATDRHYYGPGDLGQLQGEGFTPNAPVSVFIEEGVVLDTDLTADENGRIATTFEIDPESTGATHRVLATSGMGDTLLSPITGFPDFGTTVVDDGGADDVGGDGDLLYYRFHLRRDVSPRVFDVTVGWDATWIHGNNFSTIYLDTNSNGRIDLAIDTENQGEPIEPRKISSVFTCGDSSETTCEFPTRLRDLFWQSWYSVTGGDVVQNLPMSLTSLGLPADGNEPAIVNVCSLSDCIVAPGSGFLTVDTFIPQGTETHMFTFALATGAARNGTSSWSVTPTMTSQGGISTVSLISMEPGAYTLNELVPAGWRLTRADCRPSGVAMANAALPATGPTSVGLENVVINAGQVTRCKFIVERVPSP